MPAGASGIGGGTPLHSRCRCASYTSMTRHRRSADGSVLPLQLSLTATIVAVFAQPVSAYVALRILRCVTAASSNPAQEQSCRHSSTKTREQQSADGAATRTAGSPPAVSGRQRARRQPDRHGHAACHRGGALQRARHAAAARRRPGDGRAARRRGSGHRGAMLTVLPWSVGCHRMIRHFSKGRKADVCAAYRQPAETDTGPHVPAHRTSQVLSGARLMTQLWA